MRVPNLHTAPKIETFNYNIITFLKKIESYLEKYKFEGLKLN